MAQLDLTAATNVLKIMYLPGFRMNLNDELSPVYSAIENNSHKVVGEKVRLSIHTGRNPGTGSRAEFGDLPEAGTQTYERVDHDLKHHYGRVKFTGQVMRRAVVDAGAFVDAAALEMERIELDLKHDLNRQLWNTAEQFLVQASGAPTGQVVPIANATGPQLRSLLVGMKVDIGSSGTQADVANSVEIASVDTTAKTITFVAGGDVSSVVNGSYIRKEDNFGNETTGIPQIVAAGDTLFTVDGTAVQVWNSTVVAQGGAITEDAVEKMIDDVNITSGVTPNLVATDHERVRDYSSLLDSDRRYVGEAGGEYTGGFSGIHVQTGSGRVTLLPDRFCPEGEMYFLSSENIRVAEASDWEFMDYDGSIFSRILNKDGYEATLFKYCDNVTDRRNTHGKITGIT